MDIRETPDGHPIEDEDVEFTRFDGSRAVARVGVVRDDRPPKMVGVRVVERP